MITPALDRWSSAIADWSRYGGQQVHVPADVLTRRAALLDLPPATAVSSNGSCRLLRAADGWIAVNLCRPDDVTMVPALVGADGDDAWALLARWLPRQSSNDLVATARLLGLAIAKVDEAPAVGDAGDMLQGSARDWDRVPRVVDLSSLWAGPLCGAILAQAGCAVIKVETLQRPDTTAERSPAFDAWLNGGKQRLSIDAAAPDAIGDLQQLIDEADVVVTNARPRGLASLGIVIDPTCHCWIAICGHHDEPDRIGFGDDCAAAGGLIAWEDDTPRFIGDAIADPLTGLYAAAFALRDLATRRRGHRRLALASVAAAAHRLSHG